MEAGSSNASISDVYTAATNPVGQAEMIVSVSVRCHFNGVIFEQSYPIQAAAEAFWVGEKLASVQKAQSKGPK